MAAGTVLVSILRDGRASHGLLRMTSCLLFAAAVLSTAGAQTIEEKAQICSACHGENGIPQDKATPVIAGQHQGYLYLQLRDYKLGTRANDPGMTDLMRATSEVEIAAMAVYLAGR